MDATVALIATVWGFGEATLFFLVPDIYLTLVALRDARAALIACGFALAGALLGGALMYLWGSWDPSGAEAVLGLVPAIDARMVDGVRRALADSGLLAVFRGPVTGTPYKIYAVESARAGLGLPAFLAISVPARGVRFLALTALAAWVSRGPLAGWTLDRKRALGLILWTGFYLFYFARQAT